MSLNLNLIYTWLDLVLRTFDLFETKPAPNNTFIMICTVPQLVQLYLSKAQFSILFKIKIFSESAHHKQKSYDEVSGVKVKLT